MTQYRIISEPGFTDVEDDTVVTFRTARDTMAAHPLFSILLGVTGDEPIPAVGDVVTVVEPPENDARDETVGPDDVYGTDTTTGLGQWYAPSVLEQIEEA
jgi:hypothetical protein